MLPPTDPTSENWKKNIKIADWAMSIFIQVYRNNNNNIVSLLPCRFIHVYQSNNIGSLLPHLFLFTFIETKIVCNTSVSLFLVPCQFYSCLSKQWRQQQYCAMSMLFKHIKTMNDIESLLHPCSLYSCLSYQIKPTSGIHIHPAVRKWASRSTTSRTPLAQADHGSTCLSKFTYTCYVQPYVTMT